VMANPSDPVELELDKLMADDDAATAEVDKWIRDNSDFSAQGAGVSKEELNKRILDRFASVRKNYEDFLKRHPDSAHGYLAYGSFLNDTGDEEGAVDQYEKSRQLDPKNPAVWNNLANYFGEHGPLTNAFIDYAKAIELNPAEPIYYQNMATTVYLYRRDAMSFYHINEPQVFDKSLALYQQAIHGEAGSLGEGRQSADGVVVIHTSKDIEIRLVVNRQPDGMAWRLASGSGVNEETGIWSLASARIHHRWRASLRPG